VPRGGAGRCAQPLYYFSSSTVRSGLVFSSRPPPSVIGCVLCVVCLDKTQYSRSVPGTHARGVRRRSCRGRCSLERRGERHVTRLWTNAWVCVECPLQHHSTAVQLSMHIQAKVTLFSATRFYFNTLGTHPTPLRLYSFTPLYYVIRPGCPVPP